VTRARAFAVARLPRNLRSGAALALLIAASTGLRAWAARETAGPWISPDEMIYSLLGRGLYHTGHLAILGGPTPFYSLLVPAFAGIPLSLGSFAFGYGLLKVLQALVMSLAAVPVYLWAHSLVSRRWALSAAALTLAVPGLAYSGLVMSEVLFYPLLTLAAWAMASALARPAPRAQALLVAATLVLAATRLQAVVLLPAFAIALALDAALARSAGVARRLWPAIGAMSVIALCWLVWRLAAGEPLLAGYAAVTHASYGVGETAKFVAYHAASLLILTGFFPLCAVAVLLVEGLVRGERSPEVRAYLAVAGSLALCFVLQVGIFASENVGRLAERDLLGLAPVLFVGFVVWLQRGGPGSFVVAGGVALAAAALLLTLPLDRMVTRFATQDAFTLIPLLRLREVTSLHALQIVFSTGTAVAVLAFVLIPRRLLVVLPAVLLAAFAAASVSASLYVRDQAAEQRANFFGPDPRWVDHAAAGPTAYVYDGEPNWDAVWHTLFWNRKIHWVYDLPYVGDFPNLELPGPVPQRSTFLAPSGRLVATDGRADRAPYAVISSAFTFRGQPVAQIAQKGLQQAGLRLWRIEPPLRVSTHRFAIPPNGDIAAGGDGKLVAYDCRSGYHFLVTLLVKKPTTIELLRNGKLYRRLQYPSPRAYEVWRGHIPTIEGTGPARGTCTLDVRSSGLIGTTLFDIERG
jgi:hypothetical protein